MPDKRSLKSSRRPAAGRPGRKLAESVAEKIELSIVEQGWPVGAMIGSEAALLERYGVSRAVLREAIRLLEHHRVATMRRGPGGGLVVTAPDPTAVARAATLYLDYSHVTTDQLFDVRAALEVVAVKEVVERLQEADIARLRDVLDHERTFGAALDPTVHDLHRTIAALSGNPALSLLIDVLTAITAAYSLGSGALSDESAQRDVSSDTLAEVHKAHEAIVEAIITGDAALAQHRMQTHLRAMRGTAVEEGPCPM